MDKQPKLGKLPAKVDGRTLRLGSYLVQSAALPPVPAARDWSRGLPADTDPLGNDQVGDCVLASAGHFITLASQLSGLPSPVTAEATLAEYSALTGYDPARPETDRGAYMLDMLKRWRNVGLFGTRIEAFVAVESQNIPAAVNLFGGVLFGFTLPANIWTQDIWHDDGSDPKPAGGHAIFCHSTSPGLDVGNTWGLRKSWTPGWRDRWCDECYAVLLPDRPAPSGLDLEALRRDLSLL